jgi:hypothetical protein
MEIGKSLTFVFEDERWVPKLVIAAAIQLLGIIGAVVVIGPILSSALIMGYMVAITRNVQLGVARPLPEWDNWGELLVDGLKLLVALVLWTLPVLVLFFPLIAATILSGSSDEAGGIIALASLCLSCVAALWALVYILVQPVITARLAATGSLADAVSPGGVLAFTRDHLANVIVVVVVMLLVHLVAGIVGLMLCLVGVLVTAPWAYMVQGHLSGLLGTGGADHGAPTWIPAEPPYPGDVPPGGIPTDLPNPDDMVDEVRTRAESALDEWSRQTVSLEAPPEPPAPSLVWDSPAPATPVDAPPQGEPPVPESPAPDTPVLPEAPVPGMPPVDVPPHGDGAPDTPPPVDPTPVS